MNTLTRDFNVTERILLGVLGILLIAVAYYYLVHLAVADDLAAARAERDNLQTELSVVQARVSQLDRMQAEMGSMDAGLAASRMESYNNSKAEIALLNDILTAAQQYSISFSGVSRDGDQIRRSFQLSFTTDSFDSAEKILSRLTSSACRCLIGDVSCSFPSQEGQAVSLSLVATFYETMAGGTPDAGLPEDKAS
ncbi:MAG: hypothetical protein E7422_03920 [Ruminococcaceae bacterium]|jgi:cell shape-determining protein MreC|nr:hypothetical protein [Oscillospiraceae bacterium]